MFILSVSLPRFLPCHIGQSGLHFKAGLGAAMASASDVAFSVLSLGWSDDHHSGASDISDISDIHCLCFELPLEHHILR